MFTDKVLLITGGTGSFGNAMLKGFLNSDLKEIRIFSRDEKKQEDMRIQYKNDKLNFVIGDIRDFDSINHAMAGVDFVFHAAALKQVPSCEFLSKCRRCRLIFWVLKMYWKLRQETKCSG